MLRCVHPPAWSWKWQRSWRLGLLGTLGLFRSLLLLAQSGLRVRRIVIVAQIKLKSRWHRTRSALLIVLLPPVEIGGLSSSGPNKSYASS
jgi:hypothetical protein